MTTKQPKLDDVIDAPPDAGVPLDDDETVDAIEHEDEIATPLPVHVTSSTPQGELARSVSDVLDPDAARGLWPLARELAKTEFVPSGLRGKPGAVLACILTGREIGVGAMASLQNIAIISGRPVLSAKLQLALVRKAGHRVEGTSDASRAELTGTRDDTDEQLTVVWTIEDAARAGLVSIDEAGVARKRSARGEPLPWESYPAQMLWARATTELVGRLFPDVITFGVDELGSFE